MKPVVYTVPAAKDLKRHASMAARISKVVTDYAADGIAHANNVTRLVGAPAKRLRVGLPGDFRRIGNDPDDHPDWPTCRHIRVMEANMPVHVYQTPDGAEHVSLPRAEYQDLIDARDHAVAMRKIAAGAHVLAEAELDAFLAAPSPLAFWRNRAGLTQAALAQQAGITQPFLAQIESGAREGTVTTLKRIAKALSLRIEDLIAD
jgi:DNA-binding XRE family transcriptional regulator